MFAPTFLSESDRIRLLTVNQELLGKLTGEERSDLISERNDLMKQRKDMADCTVAELQQLRQQLFEQYQKHAAIGSGQIHTIAGFIKQVEHRELLILNHHIDEPAKKVEDDKSKIRSKSRVSAKQSTYSWTVELDGDST